MPFAQSKLELKVRDLLINNLQKHFKANTLKAFVTGS